MSKKQMIENIRIECERVKGNKIENKVVIRELMKKCKGLKILKKRRKKHKQEN